MGILLFEACAVLLVGGLKLTALVLAIMGIQQYY